MVTLKDQTVSNNVAAKARNTFVRKLAPNKYLVTPKHRSKTRRLVSFEVRSGQLMARCEDAYAPYEPCPANAFGVLCSHCVAAYRRAEINARKEQKRAA